MITQHYVMLQRNLLYTGVTRGKKLVVLVGQKKAIAIAVRSLAGQRRWSKLHDWLITPDRRGDESTTAHTPRTGDRTSAVRNDTSSMLK